MNFPIIEDSYLFECTKCGNCCSGDQKVNLTPYDLYKMAKFKGYSHTRYLFENNFVYLVKSENKVWIPRLKFKSIAKKKHTFCPFLINELDDNNKLLGLCSLHPGKKPLICSMAPVGRVLDFKKDSEEFVFVKPAPDCPGVEINKENNLDDLKEILKQELEYEKQFLEILDQLITKNLSQNFYLKHLYSFPVDSDIKDIFVKALQNVS